MEATERIVVRDVDDLGPVIARADHLENAIELNRKVFYSLPPLTQEFVLCHEVCHLRHNEWDENRTNELAADMFVQRATSDEDRAARKQFLAYLDGGTGQYSNVDPVSIAGTIVGIVTAVVSLAVTITSIVKTRNAGWYSFDSATQSSTLKQMLTYAFEQARASGSHSAAEYFWQQMSQFTNKDDTLNEFLDRKSNAWVRSVIVKYEKDYGFGFDEVTPVDLTAYPIVIVAIGAIVCFLIYKLVIKKRKK